MCMKNTTFVLINPIVYNNMNFSLNTASLISLLSFPSENIFIDKTYKMTAVNAYQKGKNFEEEIERLLKVGRFIW